MIDYMPINFWMALILIAFLGVAWQLASAQHRMFRAEMENLKAANDHIDRHLEALRQIDDERTPPAMLDVAIDFCQIIYDPKTPDLITKALEQDPNWFRRRKDGPRPESSIPPCTHETYALYESFVTAMTEGCLAFTHRWPHCAPAFEDMAIEFARAPVESAQIVYRLAGAAREMASPQHA